MAYFLMKIKPQLVLAYCLGELNHSHRWKNFIISSLRLSIWQIGLLFDGVVLLHHLLLPPFKNTRRFLKDNFEYFEQKRFRLELNFQKISHYIGFAAMHNIL